MKVSGKFEANLVYCFQEFEKHNQKLGSTSLIPPTVQSSETRSIHQPDGRPLRVYTDIPHVEENLTHPEFAISKFNACLE